MTNEDLIQQAFIAHYTGDGTGVVDFETRLDWWNRGWIHLAQLGPESWTVTRFGGALLAGRQAAPTGLQASARATQSAGRQGSAAGRGMP